MSIESPIGILDFHRSFQEATESEGAEVHVPDPVVDFLEADVLADAGGGDVYPRLVRAKAAIGADVPNLEAIGIVEWGQLARHRAWRRLIHRGRRPLLERFVGPLLVELAAEAIEAPLLRGHRAGGWPGSF